jgi:hypothetical protein
VDNDAQRLLPRPGLEQAQALAFLKRLPHLQQPAFGAHRDGEALFFKWRLFTDFSRNAQANSGQDALASADGRLFRFLGFDKHAAPSP